MAFGLSASQITSLKKGVGASSQIASILMNTYAAYSEQKKQEVTSKTNRALNSANQRITQASFELDKTRAKRAGERVISSLRTGISKSGIEFSGSAVDVLMDSVKELELDIFSIEFNQKVSQYEAMLQDRALEMEQQSAKANKLTAVLSQVQQGVSTLSAGLL